MGDKVHCKRCWGWSSASSAEEKGKDFVKSEEGRNYHRKCFVCDGCEISLIDTFYLYRSGGLFCLKCFKGRWGHLQCKVCGKEIMNELHKIDGKPYHIACTECTWCGLPLGANYKKISGPDRFCPTCQEVKEKSKSDGGPGSSSTRLNPSGSSIRTTRHRSKPTAPPPPIPTTPSAPPPPLPPKLRSSRSKHSSKGPAPLPKDIKAINPVESEAGGGSPAGVSPGECTICFEKPVDSVCIPCGHMAMCFDCATTYQERSKEDSACPICRSPAKSFRAYFAST